MFNHTVESKTEKINDYDSLLNEIEKLKIELNIKNQEIEKLAKKYAKLQNSMKYRIGDYIVTSIRRPWLAPQQTMSLIRAVRNRFNRQSANEVKNKVANLTSGLKAVDLELDVPEVFIKAIGNDQNIVEGYLKQLRNEEERAKFLLMLANFGYDNGYYVDGIRFAEEAYAYDPSNNNVLRRLIGLHHRTGNITKRYNYLMELKKQKGKFIDNELDLAVDEYKLLNTKWTWDKSINKIPVGEPVVHILNKYYPEINGYTVRSYEIIKQQRRLGWDPIVVTKYGWVDSEYNKQEYVMKGDIKHYYLVGDKNDQLNKIPMSKYFNDYADSLYQLFLKIKPRVVHAASNFQNALPALAVAKKAGIPTVYEVRGMWHHTQSSKTDGFENSDRFDLHEKYELYCCDIADQVVVICQSLFDYLAERGVDPGKMKIVPNAVDINEFHPIPRNQILVKKYKLEGYTVIGFIGSLTVYEGLDYLIDAFARLVKKGLKLKLLIVGTGPILHELKSQAASLGVEKDVIFTGRVPREKVKEYYSIADIFPFPRINAKVSQLVTPLKPYEAMAMKKTVIVSDIPALREMVIEGETGLVCEANNALSLADAIEKALHSEHLAEKSFEWVRNERDWSKVVEIYNSIYG